MPLFSVDYWVQPETSQNWAVVSLKEMLINKVPNTEITKQANLIVELYQTDLGKHYPLLYLNVPEDGDYPGFRYESSTYLNEYDKMRTNELLMVESSDENSQVDIIISNRDVAKNQALINIIRTLFVCVVLTMGALWFSADVNVIALQPLEKMIEKVNRIATNPIAATREIKLIKTKKSEQENETVLIQNSIVKIGQLLMLGFGEAGSEIIAMNMAKGISYFEFISLIINRWRC